MSLEQKRSAGVSSILGERQDQYLELPDNVHVEWVGLEGEGLQRLEEFVQEREKVRGDVGLDVEWKPVRSGEVPYCALLQLASPNVVFLVDLLVDRENESCQFWERLDYALSNLFSSARIRKLGFCFGDDLQRLCASHGSLLPCTEKGINNLLELNLVARLHEACRRSTSRPYLVDGKSMEKTSVADTKRTGLAGAAFQALGKSLDKSMQVSDWSRRPLRKEQIVYASIDAWVLIRIARTLVPASQRGLDLGEDGEAKPVGEAAVRRAGVKVHEGEELHKDEIGKCVAFIVREEIALLVVTRRDFKVDHNNVAAQFHVTKRQVRMATRKECIEIFGHAPQHIAPIGLRFPTLTHVFFDSCLSDLPLDLDLTCSGGTPGKIFVANVPRLLALSKAQWLEPAAAPCPEWALDFDAKTNGFVVDSMMQRSARWLRLLGLDTIYARDGQMEWVLDSAERERRVILTKSDRLVSRALRRGLPCLPVRASKTPDQLREIAQVFGIRIDSATLESRCVKCNSKSFDKLGREDVRDVVREMNLRKYSEFWRCRSCQHVYWKGTQFRNQMIRFEDLRLELDEENSRREIVG